MGKWETAYSFWSWSCQKNSKTLAWDIWLLAPKESASPNYSPSTFQSPWFDGLPFHWWPLMVCQMPKTKDFTTWGAVAAPALLLHCRWMYDLWGVRLAVNCLQVGKSMFLWREWVASLWTCCKLPQSLALWEFVKYFVSFLCCHQRNLKEVPGVVGHLIAAFSI